MQDLIVSLGKPYKTSISCKYDMTTQYLFSRNEANEGVQYKLHSMINPCILPSLGTDTL